MSEVHIKTPYSTMLYVVRGAHGVVQSIHQVPVAGSEAMEATHPDIQSFLNQQNDQKTFSSADADFVRVLEDLIDTLISNNVIRHTDLPAAAQQKLLLRKGMRNRMKGALDLLSRDDEIL